MDFGSAGSSVDTLAMTLAGMRVDELAGCLVDSLAATTVYKTVENLASQLVDWLVETDSLTVVASGVRTAQPKVEKMENYLVGRKEKILVEMLDNEKDANWED